MKHLLGAAVLLAAPFAAAACSSSSDSTAPAGTAGGSSISTGSSITALASTTAAVAANPQSVEIEDTSRTVVVRGRTVAPTRRLPTLLWLPPGTGPHPLVVVAHGYEVGPMTYARFCASIAAAGYVVAAPSFPAADASRGLGLDRDDIPEEARDVAFVVSALRSSAFATSISAGSYGVVGHSDGADVAIDVGYATGLADPRVGAVVAIAPDAFTLPLASSPPPPLLLVHSDSDEVVPYTESVQVFGRIAGRRTFVTLLGARHLAPVAEVTRWTTVVDDSTILFLHATLSGGRTIDDVRSSMAVAGLSTVRSTG